MNVACSRLHVGRPVGGGGMLFNVYFLPYLALSSRQQAANIVGVESNDQRRAHDHKNHLRKAHFAEEGGIEVSDEEKKDADELDRPYSLCYHRLAITDISIRRLIRG